MVLETEPTVLIGLFGNELKLQAASEKAISEEVLTTVHSVDDCLEIVISWLEQIAGKAYFVGPLEDYQARYGKVNPEDEFYQARMNYFLEYCVLERPMTGNSASDLTSPVTKFFEKHFELTRSTEAAAKFWTNFISFRHGVFQVLKSGSDMLLVKDLITDRSFSIIPKAGETLQYLRKKSIFQCFVFGNFDRKYLGQGLIVHPEGSHRDILKYLKNYKKYPSVKPTELLRSLAATNMRFLRMQHVDPSIIYRDLFT